jgi:phosphomannomutase
VCGYEANGGFLLSTDISLNNRILNKLPTRDAVIVLISLLLMAKAENIKLSELVKSLPSRFTHSDRLTDFPYSISHSRLKEFGTNNNGDHIRNAESVFKPVFGPVRSVNFLDGVRITFEDGNIIHLRPSGNAPEFRCYGESSSSLQTHTLVNNAMGIMKAWVV